MEARQSDQWGQKIEISVLKRKRGKVALALDFSKAQSDFLIEGMLSQQTQLLVFSWGEKKLSDT